MHISNREDLSSFLGQKMIFFPRNAQRIPQKLLSIKLKDTGFQGARGEGEVLRAYQKTVLA
jgi:hypothetical protein